MLKIKTRTFSVHSRLAIIYIRLHNSFQAFSAIAVFNATHFTFFMLPFAIRSLSEGRVAMKRLIKV